MRFVILLAPLAFCIGVYLFFLTFNSQTAEEDGDNLPCGKLGFKNPKKNPKLVLLHLQIYYKVLNSWL